MKAIDNAYMQASGIAKEPSILLTQKPKTAMYKTF